MCGAGLAFFVHVLPNFQTFIRDSKPVRPKPSSNQCVTNLPEFESLRINGSPSIAAIRPATRLGGQRSKRSGAHPERHISRAPSTTGFRYVLNFSLVLEARGSACTCEFGVGVQQKQTYMASMSGLNELCKLELCTQHKKKERERDSE